METNRLSVRGAAAAGGMLWGLAVLIVGSSNAVRPEYGKAFLDGVASIYPGYDAAASVLSVITGSLYALVDGAIGGACFAWLYNRFSGPCCKRKAPA